MKKMTVSLKFELIGKSATPTIIMRRNKYFLKSIFNHKFPNFCAGTAKRPKNPTGMASREPKDKPNFFPHMK